MKDSWCKPIRAKTGNVVSGGAARNVRIAEGGGMDQITREVGEWAAEEMRQRIEALVQAANNRRRVVGGEATEGSARRPFLSVVWKKA